MGHAVSGDEIAYWGYFPAIGAWRKVAVWNCANVIESNYKGFAVGERL